MDCPKYTASLPPPPSYEMAMRSPGPRDQSFDTVNSNSDGPDTLNDAFDASLDNLQDAFFEYPEERRSREPHEVRTTCQSDWNVTLKCYVYVFKFEPVKKKVHWKETSQQHIKYL